MARIRLLIVDDHEVVRLGLRAAFELEPDINVVGEASDGAEALAKMSVLAPQLILMDVRMERMSGIEACREIKSLYPDVSILMITSYTDNEASGQSLLDPELVKQATSRLTALASSGSQTQGGELTEREREVLVLIARGYTNKQIANTLIVTEKTARNHVSHILEKLGLARRSEAAAFAVEHKLVPPREQHKDEEF